MIVLRYVFTHTPSLSSCFLNSLLKTKEIQRKTVLLPLLSLVFASPQPVCNQVAM
jgi:hypothetical protein